MDRVPSRLTAELVIRGLVEHLSTNRDGDVVAAVVSRADVPDPFQSTTWAAFRADHHGPALQPHLTGSTHATFEDFAVLVRHAYFDRYLRHHDNHLLTGPPARHPEIRFAP